MTSLSSQAIGASMPHERSAITTAIDLAADTFQRARPVTRIAGLVTALLGAAVLVGWALDIETLKRLSPTFVPMHANAALCFLLAGVALLLQTRPGAISRRVAMAGAAIVAAIALITLAEYALALNPSIDQLLVRDPDTPRALNPGRMSLATACGLLAASLALLLGSWFVCRTARRALACSVITLGSLGAIAYLLELHFLVSALPFQNIALHSALGLMVLGGGLLAAAPARFSGEDQRIARLAAALLVITAGAAGIVSFAMIGPQVQDTPAQGLRSVLDARIQQIRLNVALRTTQAEIVTSQFHLLKNLRRLHGDPDDARAQAVVQNVLESFLPHGFSGLEISLPGGSQIARAGKFVTAPALVTPLAGHGDRSLIWRDGMYLRTRLPLVGGSGRLGTVLSEQPLPVLTKTLRMTDARWPSIEFQLCQAAGPNFRCFPTRLTPRVFTQRPAPAGTPTRLIYRAQAKGAGFASAYDYRLVSELGAYGRIGDLGLVAALKVDSDEIYAPTAQRFALTAGMVLLLALLGAGWSGCGYGRWRRISKPACNNAPPN
jgi:hypothetical protein